MTVLISADDRYGNDSESTEAQFWVNKLCD